MRDHITRRKVLSMAAGTALTGWLSRLAAHADRNRFPRQYELLRQFNAAFHQSYRSEQAEAHQTALDRAVQLMNSQQKQAFDLSRESERVHDRYGRGDFGQGCLMARRLVEAEVPFIEVIMGDGVGWDTHRDNFPRTRALSVEADVGMAALIEDLHERGRLDSTLIIWMGEFGRAPQITGGGHHHWAKAWSSVLVGGGIRGGQVIGETESHAAEVVERPIGASDFLATVCTLLGIDHTRQNVVPAIERPISIVDTTKPIKIISELL